MFFSQQLPQALTSHQWITPYPKLTAKAPEAMDGWKTIVTFPFGAFRPIFRGKLALSFREGN